MDNIEEDDNELKIVVFENLLALVQSAITFDEILGRHIQFDMKL